MASLFLTNCGLLVERFATYGNLLGIPLQIGHEGTFVSGLITHGLDPSYRHTLEQVLQRTRRGFDKGPWIPLGPLADLDTALARLTHEQGFPFAPSPEAEGDFSDPAAWAAAAKLTLERELGPGVVVGGVPPPPTDPIDRLEPERVGPATRLALRDTNPESVSLYHVSECPDAGWLESHTVREAFLGYLGDLEHSLPHYREARLLETSQSTFRYEIPGQGIFWFRKVGSHLEDQAVRKTYVASWLNEQLGLHTVPRAHFAVIPNGGMDRMVGVLSEEAPGEEPFDLRFLSGDEFSNLVAFEFLVGNCDVIPVNMRRHRAPSGETIYQVFDHGDAFVPGLMEFARTLKVAGTHLPERYYRLFIERLHDLDETKIRVGVGHLLTDPELKALCLRREIILADVELRGSAAFIP